VISRNSRSGSSRSGVGSIGGREVRASALGNGRCNGHDNGRDGGGSSNRSGSGTTTAGHSGGLECCELGTGVDCENHSLLTMTGLATIDPDGVCVCDGIGCGLEGTCVGGSYGDTGMEKMLSLKKSNNRRMKRLTSQSQNRREGHRME